MGILEKISAKARSSKALSKYIEIAKNGECPVDSGSSIDAQALLTSIPVVSDTEIVSDAHNGIQSSHLKDRERAQQEAFEIISNMGSYSGGDSYDGPVAEGKQVHFILGLPGCGKSSSMANPLSEMFHAKIIDADMVKAALPGYHDGFGAQFLHEESSDITNMLINNEKISGTNLVIPKVGDDPDKMIAKMREFKDAGYTVCAHYIELNQWKALGRNLQRYADEGRYIGSDVVFRHISDDGEDKIGKSFDKIISSGVCDAWTKWNNDVPLGTKPYFVESGNSISNEIGKSVYEDAIGKIVAGANRDPDTIVGRISEREDGSKDLVLDRGILLNSVYSEQVSAENIKIAECYNRIKSLNDAFQKDSSDLNNKLESLKSYGKGDSVRELKLVMNRKDKKGGPKPPSNDKNSPDQPGD